MANLSSLTSGRSGWTKSLGALVISSLLASGCATIDRFGGRAVAVNASTSDSKSRSIMMNVVRAAYREPLQFSDISTVAGTGQITGSLGANAPIKISPMSAARVLALNPSIGGTGTSQFNITNLNTQEFYNGLQTPISLQQIANLIDSGYDPTLVLFLAVSELDITSLEPHPPGQPTKLFVTVRNDTESADDFGVVYNALQAMVKLGFSEQAGEAEAFGPKMTPAELRDSRMVAAIQAAATTDLTLKEVKTDTFQYFKKASYSVCFDLTRAPLSDQQIYERSHQGLDQFKAYRRFTDAQRFDGTRQLVLGERVNPNGPGSIPVEGMVVPIPKESLCGFKTDKPLAANDDLGPNFKLKTRSVEGIFQFLGAIARRQNAIGVAETDKNPLNVGRGFAFLLQPGEGAAEDTYVRFQGKAFHVANDPGGLDQSTQVLQILTDLLALQSSAKNIPSPGVISIIGH